MAMGSIVHFPCQGPCGKALSHFRGVSEPYPYRSLNWRGFLGTLVHDCTLIPGPGKLFKRDPPLSYKTNDVYRQ